ncbi:hypothetical protein NDU88_004280 [Pleurodeles waltl]|uniref:Uncharacterized protein n=1 Tax=Pleurodeles waltl TaxID=8319 RepID=A0AAV7QFN4_PLEWA|nr:hypothetical protein NDU88_004280 [Pleurodeles waltl]
MDPDGSPLMADINEDEETFKQDLNMFIQTSVKHALKASMYEMSKNIENTVMSLVSNSLAHSAGEGRKHKLTATKSGKGVQLDSEPTSQQTEDLIPPRPPTKEGNIIKKPVSHLKCKSKTKHISAPKKIVISKILDTDDDDMDDLSQSDNPDDVFPPSSPPPKRSKLSSNDPSPCVVDSEGVPMFDPSLIQHPNSAEWLPLDHVGDYISSRLRLPLDKQTRSKLKSECPRPSLDSNITATPSIDQSLISFFTKFGKDPRKGVDKAWTTCQDKLLDVVGPLTRIFDLAETARLEDSPRFSKSLLFLGKCQFGNHS